MSEARCAECGTELIPGTGFCRKCGAPAISALEQPTAILDQPSDGTTKRLEPRSTNPYREASLDDPLGHELPAAAPPGARPRKFLFLGVLVLAALACVSIVGVVRSVLKSPVVQPSVRVDRSLMYPEARVVVDMGDSGGGVLQMTTRDPLSKVQSWYVEQMKPDKVLQVTYNSTIMRKDKVMTTLIAENDITSIVIKQAR
ncbi:MAG TPA: zinc ribbon domain-containing protein [Pyrinomonadaceae bacterium]|nr:zinc ribbon domain-containing protein [Pyrinomonadaceae bacterium]